MRMNIDQYSEPMHKVSIMDSSSTKRVVLVGCNYPKTQFSLHGCINDVKTITDVILSDVYVLIDVLGSSIPPTGANIKDALNRMVKKAKPGSGDVLFFYFSGHGTRIPIFQPGQPFKHEEAIAACDLNLVTDVDFKRLVNRLPEGASFTILSDSCHSGGLIEKEKEQLGAEHTTTPLNTDKPKPSQAKAKGLPFYIIHSGIDTAADILHDAANVGQKIFGIFGKDMSLKFHPHNGDGLMELDPLEEDEGILLTFGAFTLAVVRIIDQHMGAGISNRKLMAEAAMILKDNGYEQNPCLYCSDGNTNAAFLGGFA
ncbi:metacaspase-9-like [Gossypium arboreum]|uniref:metacaspase-9-like n=1 Tax=Gossypium arboreum TaxID=29729 RepID=UPI0008190728|nr:metacaspase-9-like [Gossypium arboreum]